MPARPECWRVDNGALPVKEPRDIWFARRFPIGSTRSGMAPINWKGWVVVAVFLLVLLVGAAAFGWFAYEGDMVKGVTTFVAFAFGAGLFFIKMANDKGDHIHTVADYVKGKLSV